MECAPLPGCGTQHPHRALGGTRVLLAAAPTTPPCFRHWRRSSLLHFAHIQQKNYLKFWGSETPAGVSEPHFHRWELPQSKPDGFASSLWEGASGAPGHLLIAPNTLATGLTPCALSVTCGDSSPKGRAKSTAENFLFIPNTLVSELTAWLSLRGKTSPAPGEDVTVGDKRGNLARERLRGRASSGVPGSA